MVSDHGKMLDVAAVKTGKRLGKKGSFTESPLAA
jgi:hypothetical protein